MAMQNVSPNDFKPLNKIMVLNFRLGFGPFFTGWLKDLGHIMVLTTIGRKSGRQRRTPVNYALVRGDVYCVAGFGQQADWFRNVQVNPEVEVWIGNQRYAGLAERVENASDWLPAYRQVMVNSGFAAKTFMGLDPATAPDETLRQAGADTPLVRIRIERALTGRGGPGDLIWVWPALAAVSLLLLLPKRK
jgi:deazaflavin-dependent oxidoreductase (nitroreductase family)